ncbi:Aminopeptidase N [Cryptotermes secundus]|uniref:Aminopeptidase n=1 Tax=Cryptotermes secundus TaxID=105785 RepID=A0A2J7QZU5_9NEOP|nr:aminopeptidase N isoform X2 [Cryptotermes secundus]PNF34108.1 Aminopeptidase N [Cryptotermes secundus]
MNGRSEIPATTDLQAANCIDYGKQCSRKGYFISRKAAVLIAVVYICSLVLTGLLVFYCVPRSSSSKLQASDTNLARTFRMRPQVTLPYQKTHSSNRLTTHTIPTHYRIQLVPFIMEDNFTTSGEVWITLKCLEAADNITLNINDIEVQESSVKVTQLHPKKDLSIQVVDHVYNTDAQTYSSILDQQLMPGGQYELYIKFMGHINDHLQGFYRSSYFDPETGQKRWLASTQFSPTDARRAFPCFDEPAFKARFTVSLARSANLSSLSNMPLNFTEPMSEIPGWEWDHYNETVPMSTYLVAFIISDLHSLDATMTNLSISEDSFRFTVWAREFALPQTSYAARIGPRILHYLETYFNIPFPLPKQDMVALPDFGFSAMENWGLITFRESALLYDANISTEVNKERVAEVVSHELAHQWFGNLVTPWWWNDLWLKEGFATFIGYQGLHHVEPSWRNKDQFIRDHLQEVLMLDALESSHPISVPVQHTDQIREIFDRVSYCKGASVIRMMNHFLGEETFKRGLTNYLEVHKFSNARQDDLWQQLTLQAHQDGSLPLHMTVKEIMDTWTLQTGYPVVTVTRNYLNVSAYISQERFLLSSNTITNATWWVPLTFTTQEAPDFNMTQPQLWLENVQSTVVEGLPGNTSWVLFNVHETGFYRVNYDHANWRLLISSFQQLPDVTRAQLLDDSLNLALSGRLEYRIAMDLTSQLITDVEYLPWSAALTALEHLDTMLALTPAYGNFKHIVLALLDKVYNSLQFEDRALDSHLDLLNRAQVLSWACRLDHEFCVWNAKNKYRRWMTQELEERETGPISPNQKEVVYCTAIKHGGADVWNFAWKKYQLSNVGSDKEHLLEALGCSREPWILNRYLSWITSNSSGIRKQDGARVFVTVANNVVGHSLAFNFLRDNWDALQSYYGVAFSSISRMVSAIATYMNTPLQLSQLEKLQDENADKLGTTTQSFKQAIEVVRANVQWMANSYNEVNDWLESYSKSHYL